MVDERLHTDFSLAQAMRYALFGYIVLPIGDFADAAFSINCHLSS